MAAAPKDNDLTSGPIMKQLWSLSWPMMLSVFFYTLYNIVDAYWVSKISADAIAAVSISQLTLFLMISLGFGITIGSGVIMSMDLGAKNKTGAEKVLGQSFVLTMIVGAFFSMVALVFRDPLLQISGAAGSIYVPAQQYFTVTAASAILYFILFTVMFAFNAQGDTFTLTKLFALSTLVNLILDPLFIFGWSFFPQLGISGAAVATVISQAIFIIIAMRALSSPKRNVQFHFSNLRIISRESVGKVLKIGIPAALTQVINPIGMMALTFIVSKGFLEAGTVAFSLGFRVEFFAYLPAVGFGFGSMAMMAQAIGAHKLDRAKEVLMVAIKFGASIALVLGLLAFVFAYPIVRFFTTDPLVVHHAVAYLHTVSLTYAFIAIMMVVANAFQAVGRSWPGFWIQFIRLIGVSLPLAYILTFVLGLPIQGMWMAVMAGNTISAVVGYFWIRRMLSRFDFKQVDDTVHVA